MTHLGRFDPLSIVPAADRLECEALILAVDEIVEESRLLVVEVDRLLQRYEQKVRPLAFALATPALAASHRP